MIYCMYNQCTYNSSDCNKIFNNLLTLKYNLVAALPEQNILVNEKLQSKTSQKEYNNPATQ